MKLVPKVIIEGTRLTHKTDIAFALAERVKVSGKPSQYDDLQVFVNEQQVMEGFITACNFPTLRADISDNDVPRAVEAIADWLEATGGLYMDDR